MGTGFTIDTPLHVARFGISSVISLVDDFLMEKMRRLHSLENDLPYQAISDRERDSRARRVTAYLDMIDGLVERQVRELQTSPFVPGSPISRYFEMLPESKLRRDYLEMLNLADGPEKTGRQNHLRGLAVPGDIDVNIMTKLDCASRRQQGAEGPDHTDAMAALRGYAASGLRSSIVFSAGINPRLYGSVARFDDFFPDAQGGFRKKITLKVSDFRSAVTQGKFLAKRGLWVSEFRIESGLNCGGHAFATAGHLMGPVLEEFRSNRDELFEMLLPLYTKALEKLDRPLGNLPPRARITVQGGIGTATENDFLLRYYHLNGTGWGTPFLLVPEVTNVDEVHLDRMINARAGDVYLSDSSPLGIGFWNLRTSDSEENRRRRIRDNRPGSPCPKGFAAYNTDLTDRPVCPASSVYIKLRLEQLCRENLTSEALAESRERILDKACICHDLAGGAARKHGLDPEAKPSVCCGPNILNFGRTASLEEMVAHIYGRLSLLRDNDRPHMFVQELRLYVDQLRKDIRNMSLEMSNRPQGYCAAFKDNLLSGIDYYRNLAGRFLGDQRERFFEDLKTLRQELEMVPVPAAG